MLITGTCRVAGYAVAGAGRISLGSLWRCSAITCGLADLRVW